MWSAKSDDELLASLTPEVRDAAGAILGSPDNGITIRRVELDRPRHRKHNRHHRLLRVHYDRDGAVDEKPVWLKFVTKVQSRFEVHEAAWEQTRELGFFPRPYFKLGSGEREGIIAMEQVQGAAMREAFLRRAALRSTGRLYELFGSLGSSLRTFHDSWRPFGELRLGELTEQIYSDAGDESRLTPGEADRLSGVVREAEQRAGGADLMLPTIRLHHDCTLRNVIVRPERLPCLVDLDSMRSEPKPRWYDIAVFLVNLESQLRYSPLVAPREVATAWDRFWEAYAGAALPDDLTLDNAHALLLLMKADMYVRPKRPVPRVYRGYPASRYVDRLKDSLLRGSHSVLR